MPQTLPAPDRADVRRTAFSQAPGLVDAAAQPGVQPEVTGVVLAGTLLLVGAD